jgi:hypothetical protein
MAQNAINYCDFFNSLCSVGGGHFVYKPWVHINITKPLITKINQLIFFSDIIVTYCEYHTKDTNKLCGQNTSAGGTCTGVLISP